MAASSKIRGGFFVFWTDNAMVHSGVKSQAALGTAIRAQPSRRSKAVKQCHGDFHHRSHPDPATVGRDCRGREFRDLCLLGFCIPPP